MKLTGRVNRVARTVAKRTADGTEAKEEYAIDLRPVGKESGMVFDYGYGALRFYAHGKQIGDLGISLDDEVDVILVRSGEVYDGKSVEDLNHALYQAEAKINDLNAQAQSALKRVGDYQRADYSERQQAQALKTENIRLATENEMLRGMVQGLREPAMLSISTPKEG